MKFYILKEVLMSEGTQFLLTIPASHTNTNAIIPVLTVSMQLSDLGAKKQNLKAGKTKTFL